MNDCTDGVEWHILGMHYCGPGTHLELYLQPNGKTPKPGWEPINHIDKAAIHHDLYDSQHPTQHECAQVGDKLMIDELQL